MLPNFAAFKGFVMGTHDDRHQTAAAAAAAEEEAEAEAAAT